MKKSISFLLVFVMLFALLAVGASAANTVLSAQKLTCEGKSIECEKYNIDGSNYFKLRDIAYLLNGTVSQFSVGWDSEAKVVSIVTGEAYEANGSELDLSSGDQSATAVTSSQTIKINGIERTDLSVYNIGGSNFFKLRDLGGALGFFVDYDKATNTAVIKSLADVENPDVWLTSYDITDSMGYLSKTSYSYDESGRIVKTETVDSSGFSNTSTTYTYDAAGNLLSTEDSGGFFGGKTEYTYDANGNVLTSNYASSDGSTTYSSKYTYDANGNVLTEETTSVSSFYPDGDGTSLTTYTYDADGNLTKIVVDGSYAYTAEYTYDAEGNEISETFTSADSSSKTEYTYDANGNVLTRKLESHSADGDYSSVMEFTYNDNGDPISRTGDGETTVYTYSAEGVLLSEVTTDAEGAETYRTEYNADGNVIFDSYGTEGDPYYSETVYSYDALGNVLSSSNTGSFGSTYISYSYDYVAGTYSTYTSSVYDMSSFGGFGGFGF